MSMFTLRRSQKQSGFTLMELLIVIAVLGLLLGMLIPRLAGVTDDTVDTVCDSNNKGIRYFTQIYYNTNGTLPDGLTNMVDKSIATGVAVVSGDLNAAAQAYMPAFQHDSQTSQQVLAAEFWTRNVPSPYTLDQDEVDELKEMGISTVYDLMNVNERAMYKHTLKATDTVMMMGMSDSAINFAANYPVGNPEWIGRIMMAVNDKCDLIKTGLIQASALCPGAVLAEEDFSHKEYILVLPRLAATLAKENSPIAANDTYYFVASDASVTGTGAGETLEYTDGRILEVVIEAQDAWNFDMSCPEGHKWPDNDEDFFINVSYDESADEATEGTLSGTIYTVTAS